jgi:hypothetical protein
MVSGKGEIQLGKSRIRWQGLANTVKNRYTHSENGGRKFLWNVGIHLLVLNYTPIYHRRRMWQQTVDIVPSINFHLTFLQDTFPSSLVWTSQERFMVQNHINHFRAWEQRSFQPIPFSTSTFALQSTALHVYMKRCIALSINRAICNAKRLYANPGLQLLFCCQETVFVQSCYVSPLLTN